ncbi:MAG: pitrilysin family protein [Rikenellaceae bacterium]
MEYYIIELPNGIKGVLKRIKSPVVYSAITIGTGSCDEFENEHGAAHFLEHLFFKGTKKRKQYHINSLLDNVGGELNAYTTKEETVIHSSVLKSDFRKAVDLMSDVTFNSLLLQKEIDREREVIFDEINSYKDSPSEQIFDSFEDIVFEGSSLGHPILGSKKTLKKIDSQTLHNFIERTYNSDKIVFSVIGNITPEKFTLITNEFFGGVACNPRKWSREPLLPYKVQNFELARHTHQCHILMGTRAYNHHSGERATLSLLVNLLGGQSPSSILNQQLREKNGLTYNIESSYSSFEKSGLFTIYLSCDNEKRERSIELVHKEINKLRDSRLSDFALSKYKKQLIGQIAIASDSFESLMLSSARSLLVYGEIDSFNDIKTRINSISSQDIQRVANEIMDINNFSTLIYK